MSLGYCTIGSCLIIIQIAKIRAINNIFNKNVLFSYITVPPHKPNIIDERGTVPAVAGPYEEGGDMKLQCLVSGGEFSLLFSIYISTKSEKLLRSYSSFLHKHIKLFSSNNIDN